MLKFWFDKESSCRSIVPCITTLIVSVCLLFLSTFIMKPQNTIPDPFENSIDVGSPVNKGSVEYNPNSELYTIKGSGTNMWFNNDEFHFLYRKMSGNVLLYTCVNFLGEGANPHRKAGVIIRTDLTPGSPYISISYHGDGLVAMQYRLYKDSATHEIRSENDALNVLQLFKNGDTITAMASTTETPLKIIGKQTLNITKNTEFYIGLFVCSHEASVIEEAHFSNTRLVIPAPDNFIPYTDYIGARLETLEIATGKRNIVFESDLPVEAPNWSHDDKFFMVNANGRIFKIPVTGGEAELVNTDFAISNNNDHGISPDGSQLVISHHAIEKTAGENSTIYILPASGGTPREVTRNSPSYWHGWSPDGKKLIYTAKRNNQWNIYEIPAEGGEEKRLTDVNALDDGSEYSVDGRYIWFNSNRTGIMEIWRMNSDGSNPVQITKDNYQNWFAHESPQGDKLVFLSYGDDVNQWDHPYYKHVMLRMLPLKDGQPTGEPKVIAHLYGGQGTINVPSWSPDGKKIAFVSNTQLIK
jgi:TolB protein